MRICLLLSRNTYTSVEYWLNLPLTELAEWVKASVDLAKEIKEAR